LDELAAVWRAGARLQLQASGQRPALVEGRARLDSPVLIACHDRNGS